MPRPVIDHSETNEYFTIKVTKPSLRYIDFFLKLKSAAKLIDTCFYPNAKEISETQGAFEAVRHKLKLDYNDESIAILVVGDGYNPRTGYYIANMTKWTIFSIDPAMERDYNKILEKINYKKNINIIAKKLGDMNNTMRTYRLGYIRNDLTSYLLNETAQGKTNADLVLMIDTDVIFSGKTVQELINNLSLNAEATMIGSYSLTFDEGYYDTLALDMGKWYFSRYVFLDSIKKSKELHKVTSCFGGLCLTYKHVLNYCHWGNSKLTLYGFYSNVSCEHYHFCRGLSSFGNIYVAKMAVSYWVENWKTQSELILHMARNCGFYNSLLEFG